VSVYRIPTSSGPEYASTVQRTALDGRDYILRLQWNMREGKWYLSLSDQDDVPLAMGLKVTARRLLLVRVTDERRPPGEIMCSDLAGDGADPSLYSFGVTHELLYFDRDEFEL
jgi:hypothetical protein